MFLKNISSLKLLFSSVVPKAYKEIKKNLKGKYISVIAIAKIAVRVIIRLLVSSIS